MSANSPYVFSQTADMEDGMEKLFCLGVAIGMVGGALLVANSYKARSLVKKSQAELLDKMDEMMDERLKAMESGEGEEKKTQKKK